MDGKKDLQERALVELNANPNLRLHFDLSLIEVISILGALQLALRHPKNTGPSTSLVREFIQRAVKLLDGLPAIQQAIKSEDDPYPDWKPRKRRKGEGYDDDKKTT